MNYEIDKNSKIPAYLQLYRLLAADIVSGAYGFSDRLPSKRTICAETGVSVITAEHALELLCEEGYIEARPRSGYYAAYRRSDRGSQSKNPNETGVESEPQQYPDLAAADPAQSPSSGSFPFSVLAKSMRKVLLDYGDRILVKSPNAGCMELRSQICAYLARSRGIQVKASQVIIGSGAEYLYGLIVQLLEPERVFALEEPSYVKIRSVYESMGICCDMLPLTSDGLLAEALSGTTAKVLHVTPFHSYPSGISVSISKKHEYLNWAEKRQGIIIEDNYDSELTVSRKAEESLFSMAIKDDPRANVIYVNTFSKTIAPSVRVGYMILPDTMTDLFYAKLGFYSCTVPLFEQYVLADLLKNGDFERHINRIRRKRRKELQETGDRDK